MDIGAGEGYVSHYISQEYGYRVIAVESNCQIAESGEIRAERITKVLKKRAKNTGKEGNIKL